MGGNRFQNRSKGASMQEAYRTAVDYAEREHGHQQGYSGEINCTGGVVDVTSEWKKSKLTHNQFIQKKENEDKLTKGNAYGLCIKEPKKNTNKIKTHVEHNVVAGTKKWILYYTVYQLDEVLGEYKTKGDAVKRARSYTEKTGKRTIIEMTKKLEKVSPLVATITYKSSKDETPGEYVFFGIAPC